jgi:hypothetical protein
LLFSEPSIAETDVWCCLSNSIDPAEWVIPCRYIGSLCQKEFDQIKSEIMPNIKGVKHNFRQCVETFVNIPLVSIGSIGIGESIIARLNNSRIPDMNGT